MEPSKTEQEIGRAATLKWKNQHGWAEVLFAYVMTHLLWKVPASNVDV